MLKIGRGVELPLSVVTSKAAIMAMTGMGKTYLARVMAEEMMKAGARIIVADYLGVWHGLQSSASGKREGYPVVIFGGDHADVAINESAGPLIADTVVHERINAVLDVSGWEDDAPKIRFVTAFARRLFHINKKPVHFFIDEADEFVPQQPQRDQIQMLAVLKRIWQRGRVLGIGGTIISQRPAIVHKTLLTQSEMLIALRTVGPQDRAALEEWFKSWGTAEQIKEFTSTISNLPDYHAWFWSPKHRLFVQSKARTAETFDSSKTPDVDAAELVEPERRAKVDVVKLGKQIEALAAEAKANDPEALKAELMKATHIAFTQAKEIKELSDKLTRLKASREKKPGPSKKVPFLTSKAYTRIDKTLRDIERTRKNVDAVLKAGASALADDMDVALKTLKGELERATKLALDASTQAISDQTWDETDPAVATREDVKNVYAEGLSTGMKLAPGKVTDYQSGNGVAVTDSKRRILIALAQHGSTMSNRLRVLAAITSKHTFRKYMGELRSKGMITNGEPVAITDLGKRTLGTYESLPTGRALIDYWRRELGDGGHRKIFDALVSKSTYAFPPDELRKAAGIESEHTFRKYMGRMRTLGLATDFGKMITLASDFKDL